MLGTSPPSSHAHIGVVMDATGGRSRSRAVLGRKNRVLSDGRSKKPSLADAKTCLLWLPWADDHGRFLLICTTTSHPASVFLMRSPILFAPHARGAVSKSGTHVPVRHHTVHKVPGTGTVTGNQYCTGKPVDGCDLQNLTNFDLCTVRATYTAFLRRTVQLPRSYRYTASAGGSRTTCRNEYIVSYPVERVPVPRPVPVEYPVE